MSNLQTRAVRRPEEHPIHLFYQSGIRVTVNTDNPTVSGTDLAQEHRVLQHWFPFSDQDFIRMDCYAAEGAFLSQKEKMDLLRRIEKDS